MRSLLTGLSVFISLLILTQYLAYQRYVIATDVKLAETKNEAEAIRNNLQSSLSYSLAATKTLAFIIDRYGVPSNFDSIASAILQSNKYIDALELTSGGVITHVYPLEGNESAIGYDVLKDPVKGREAYKAIEKGRLFFAGPFELKQGGIAVVGRLPLYKNGKFTGFSVVLIKLATLLKAAGIDQEHSDFQYQLSKLNPVTHQEEFFLPNTFPVREAHTTIEVPDGEWLLYVQPKRDNDTLFQVLPFSLLGVFLSVIAGMFVWYLSRQPQRLNALVRIRTEQVHSLNRIYHFMSRINQLMVKLKDEQAVLHEVCSIAVEVGGFAFAWIGAIDHQKGLVTSSCHAGAEQGYLKTITPLDLKGKALNGPIATVMATGNPVYSNNVCNDPLFRPWIDEATTRGYKSCILLPLRKSGEIVASLNLYSFEEGIFDEQEVKVLIDVATDISFALDNIERDKLFREAVQQTESEKFLSDSIINSMPGVFYLYDRNLQFKRWNKNLELVTGYSAEEFKKISPVDLFPEEEKGLLKTKISNVFSVGSDDVIAHFLRKDGTKVPYYFNGKKIRIQGEDYLVGMGIDITQRVEAETALLERTEQIRKLTGYLQQIREEERKNISREIHDELGQQLTGLKMDASWLRKYLDSDPKALERIIEMMTLIDETIRTVRRISSQLRPGILDDLGLIAALDWQASEFEKRTGIPTTFTCNVHDLCIDERLGTNIFRIFQEALTNVARHAKASKVETYFSVDGDKVELVIADNGEGIHITGEKKDSLGIVGMKERARMFEGDVSIEPNAPSGTIVRLIIPEINKTFVSHEVSDLR